MRTNRGRLPWVERSAPACIASSYACCHRTGASGGRGAGGLGSDSAGVGPSAFSSDAAWSALSLPAASRSRIRRRSSELAIFTPAHADVEVAGRDPEVEVRLAAAEGPLDRAAKARSAALQARHAAVDVAYRDSPLH